MQRRKLQRNHSQKKKKSINDLLMRLRNKQAFDSVGSDAAGLAASQGLCQVPCLPAGPAQRRCVSGSHARGRSLRGDAGARRGTPARGAAHAPPALLSLSPRAAPQGAGCRAPCWPAGRAAPGASHPRCCWRGFGMPARLRRKARGAGGWCGHLAQDSPRARVSAARAPLVPPYAGPRAPAPHVPWW